jgi:hypothetical protein
MGHSLYFVIVQFFVGLTGCSSSTLNFKCFEGKGQIMIHEASQSVVLISGPVVLSF